MQFHFYYVLTEAKLLLNFIVFIVEDIKNNPRQHISFIFIMRELIKLLYLKEIRKEKSNDDSMCLSNMVR